MDTDKNIRNSQMHLIVLSKSLALLEKFIEENKLDDVKIFSERILDKIKKLEGKALKDIKSLEDHFDMDLQSFERHLRRKKLTDDNILTKSEDVKESLLKYSELLKGILSSKGNLESHLQSKEFENALNSIKKAIRYDDTLFDDVNIVKDIEHSMQLKRNSK